MADKPVRGKPVSVSIPDVTLVERFDAVIEKANAVGLMDWDRSMQIRVAMENHIPLMEKEIEVYIEVVTEARRRLAAAGRKNGG